MVDSSDLMRRIERAGSAMDPGLTDRDVERIVHAASRRRRRRAIIRAAFAATALAVVALVAVRFAPRHGWSTAPEVAAKGDGRLRLGDGSLATPIEPGSTLTLLAESSERVDLGLQRGRARFEVVPSPKRVFSVQAGEVTVTVLGTAFTVERVADRIGVVVERGTVRVDWKVGTRQLHEGESGWFPPLLVESNGDEVSPSTPNPAPPPIARTHEAKRSASKDETTETADRLLAEADAERAAGHAEQGAAILRRLLRDHAHDVRAPLAAFTLGRLLLMELDRPGEAAAAFAQVRALAPRGPFAEDALAREVEAWKRAGDADKVRARAQEYLKNYPSGRRVNTVRILSGLE